MNAEELILLLDQARKIKKRKNPKIPPINGDFFQTGQFMNAEEQHLLEQVRAFAKNEIEPIATEYWMKGEFPFHIIEGFKKLDISGLTVDKRNGLGMPPLPIM